MTDQIIARIEGTLGRITLNRAKALNALTTEMCVAMTEALTRWLDDDRVRAVVVDGAGDRAFCAGGDVIMLHDSGKAKDGRAEAFWRTEYALNELIHRYAKPYVALIDGIVMGGGVGLSVHGRFRVAGDTTLFAMPETGIGYFPDVGGTYFLPRLGRAVGNWLGLTGARLGPAQCVALGIATHFVPTERHAALMDALDGADDVQAVLSKFETAAPDGDVIPDSVSAFDAQTVAEILAALDADGSAWAAQQAKLIRRKSPLALATTLEAMRRGGGMDFQTAMMQELDLSLNFLTTQDFYEGIRAQLIDKDRNPGWSHDALSDVTQAQIERLFRPVADPRQQFLD
ncbi:enoyl-CoA hydratase/isomerase family protein [Algimonas porphyrae]|uniref:3-hydroxyisobutyryl-CoA hydrolase n=1 Tax=Algimonas porphyrae TaxID=1128113 RepID=A0ABQ5V0A0_9PROT|nr:enoyl-CoA hydratase/isomerase family protein [Algimonas porphyrae]GLQ20848.1 enoyl-CoA hydratase [Algimonas porphyrae]